MGISQDGSCKIPLAPLYERGNVALQHCSRDPDTIGNASSREAESSTWALRHGKWPWAICPATLDSDHFG